MRSVDRPLIAYKFSNSYKFSVLFSVFAFFVAVPHAALAGSSGCCTSHASSVKGTAPAKSSYSMRSHTPSYAAPAHITPHAGLARTNSYNAAMQAAQRLQHAGAAHPHGRYGSGNHGYAKGYGRGSYGYGKGYAGYGYGRPPFYLNGPISAYGGSSGTSYSVQTPSAYSYHTTPSVADLPSSTGIRAQAVGTPVLYVIHPRTVAKPNAKVVYKDAERHGYARNTAYAPHVRDIETAQSVDSGASRLIVIHK
jgi:hypothetical protein